MRLFPLCVFALMLTGCSVHHELPARQPLSSAKHSEPARNKYAHRATSVQIYTSPTELLSKPFRDLGEVSGEDCQSGSQDSPANINTARKRMQIKASELKANAVLLHQCAIVTTTAGCYRQALCQGSALQVSAQ